jgi:acylphosphatase
MTEKALAIRIKGRVQGVGFRYYAQKKATELGIRGFVKNMRDGSVYIEAEASPDHMEMFVGWCHHGPEWARVDSVSLQDKGPEGFKGFAIH